MTEAHLTPVWDMEWYSAEKLQVFRWQEMAFVRAITELMSPGDDLVLHRLDSDASPDAEYAEEEGR
jgi:hypothetical protein